MGSHPDGGRRMTRHDYPRHVRFVTIQPDEQTACVYVDADGSLLRVAQLYDGSWYVQRQSGDPPRATGRSVDDALDDWERLRHNPDRQACQRMQARGRAAFHAGEPVDNARRNTHALDEACWRDGWLKAQREGDDLHAALREYDDDADALADDLGSIQARMRKGTP